MAKYSKKNIGIAFVLIVFMAIGIYLSISNSFSILGEDSFSNCKFIKQGDVCDKYTECYHSEEKQASCIKGIEQKYFEPNMTPNGYITPEIIVEEYEDSE